ncbi:MULTISPECIES: phosphate ABC transporter permease PstA [Paracoccus]|jgi:phosphate transport system permease protein|uniref:Phosphate transport system permease protein PstA n=1 Tax=Paracoccus denitrificans (strain Pd 1222) TaxID=318586 RepID=A1BA48_PARDP|nr:MULTISPECIES: phosphate ABC transporter permease PstA [Paracoccus]ABL72392.1 phosphate ABC transporter membrane protein 2, PhoT family [Paracoccus denitrificans PD1222]MBB4628524.1 phosphate transport system permease protein [Paracoccus denitrificans]MCU7430175.1 phosphate ABC transporter permease PstA [Paracoccus denitrificans]MDK8873906.1 phosphate ABC transporter permease PstA [Paracoccus sp. SSJ]QAR28953.1 phosphate ABC transporter permease PstA [Paracoccus denitrificans]
MSDATLDGAQPRSSLLVADPRTRKRNAAEARFRAYGLGAIVISMIMLVILLFTIVTGGVGAFRQTYLEIPVALDAAQLDKNGNRDPADIRKVLTLTYGKILEQSLQQAIADKGIAVAELSAKDVSNLISKEASAQLRNRVLADPELIGQTVEARVLVNGRVDGYYKGRVSMESAARDANTSPAQLQLADALKAQGMLATEWNWSFLTSPDASDQRPEAAGVGIAILGSLYMMLVVLALAVPIGVAASIYLEEFAPKNRWTDIIEVNISNLAAVPSIVFGILGLAAFINFAGLPQSAPIVGGLVLTLMTLPTIIIATRAALKAVPPSIRDAALGVGASKMQSVFHHVLPLAMPGILTGTIIGLAQALGETAPLLLIGMVAFVKNFPSAPPDGLFEPASALPVQVYNWTQRADPAFIERASGAIIVLLAFLLCMNLLAILLRRKFERRW